MTDERTHGQAQKGGGGKGNGGGGEIFPHQAETSHKSARQTNAQVIKKSQDITSPAGPESLERWLWRFLCLGLARCIATLPRTHTITPPQLLKNATHLSIEHFPPQHATEAVANWKHAATTVTFARPLPRLPRPLLCRSSTSSPAAPLLCRPSTSSPAAPLLSCPRNPFASGMLPYSSEGRSLSSIQSCQPRIASQKAKGLLAHANQDFISSAQLILSYLTSSHPDIPAK